MELFNFSVVFDLNDFLHVLNRLESNKKPESNTRSVFVHGMCRFLVGCTVSEQVNSNCAYSRTWPTILPHVLWWNAKLENTTFSRYCKALMMCLIWYTANIQFRPLGDPAWVYVTSWTNQLVGILFIMSRISVNNVSLTRHFIIFTSGWLSSFEELAYHQRFFLYFSMYILCPV